MRQLKYFAIKDVFKRLTAAAERNRFDQVTRTMHNIYEKKYDTNPNQLVSTADFQELYSTISNLNTQSNFKDLFDDILSSDKEPVTVTGNSAFQLSGFEGDDYRPTPVEKEHTFDEKIQSASLNSLKRIASKVTVNPQYHYGNFVAVAKAGKNSGVALWTVAFNTGKGIAKINVPIHVVNGETMLPEIFFVKGSKQARPFTEKELSKFAKEYAGEIINNITEDSGFENIGINTYITDNLNIPEGPEVYDEIHINPGIDLTDDSLIASSDVINAKYIKAIDIARQHIDKKLSSYGKNMQLKFGGIMTSEGKEITSDAKDENVIVAFNAELDSKTGKKLITIPVVVANDTASSDKFYTNYGEHDLNNNSISSYINKENEVSKEDQMVDAFANALLAANASLEQLTKEIKSSIETSDMLKAKACLNVIGKKYGQQKLKIAMADFLYQVQENNMINNEEKEYNNIHIKNTLY